MRSSILFVLFLVFSPFIYCQEINKFDAADTKAINDVAAKWQMYWNDHNMVSFATLFADNVDFVTKSGTWLRGKTATMSHHKNNHETIFKNSKWEIDSVIIKYVKADLAIVHIGWGISGDIHHNGTPSDPRHGISTWVLMKQNNKWLLLAVQNANIEAPL